MLKTQLLKETGRVRVSVRRGCDGECPQNGSHHVGCEILHEEPVQFTPEGYISNAGHMHLLERQPNGRLYCPQCTCGKPLLPDDPGYYATVNVNQLYERVGTGEFTVLSDAHPGDVWRAPWYENRIGHRSGAWGGPDGQCWVAVCPDGRQWFIDGPCNNCTRKGEPHHCWVRHGEPPNFTVDKAGDTCAAGGGSIDTGTWHGHLVRGWFVLNPAEAPA